MSSHNEYIPTTLGYAILGLIQRESMSGYQIRKEFETTPLGHYSSSPGSIYPALRRLQQEGLLQRVSVSKAASSKKKYTLTTSGLASLVDWFNKPVTREEVVNGLDDLLLRFAMMGDLVDRSRKTVFLNDFKREAEAYIATLRLFRTSASVSMPLNGLLALDHGIESYKTHARWASYALEAIVDGPHNTEVS